MKIKITKTQEKDLIVYAAIVHNNTYSFAHPEDVKVDTLDVVNILLDMIDKQSITTSPSSGTVLTIPNPTNLNSFPWNDTNRILYNPNSRIGYTITHSKPITIQQSDYINLTTPQPQ